MTNIRKKILVYLAHEVALPYFKLVRKGYKFPYSVKQLQRLPAGTVGHALFHFFEDNQLEMLPHYEKHDVKHVVLGYPPTEEGEVSLQCFMLANGRVTLPVIFSVMVGLIIMPDKWRVFANAWKRGNTTQRLSKLDWFRLIPLPLATVQAQIFGTTK